MGSRGSVRQLSISALESPAAVLVCSVLCDCRLLSSPVIFPPLGRYHALSLPRPGPFSSVAPGRPPSQPRSARYRAPPRPSLLPRRRIPIDPASLCRRCGAGGGGGGWWAALPLLGWGGGGGGGIRQAEAEHIAPSLYPVVLTGFGVFENVSGRARFSGRLIRVMSFYGNWT